jgi:hypothetical protein
VRLDFELDPQIIHHIIYSQAGSIGKALIELIMNSVDAQATRVALTITKTGFACSDDGNGFLSREDVIRYFGRFGTPHQEGDATYGRFRLGRGQIMAHAITHWRSNAWGMGVDTRSMGYSYELDDISPSIDGCTIDGTWYEELAEAELQSSLQEIRDLVRYTPVEVDLNGRRITKTPANETWDHEDEYAYYRVREEGAVSIYNQGVLVRHDPAGTWGAGGLIVSKKAIGLNVSRTEILRKTCPVWRPIAARFGKMADEMSSRLGDHRKTEARRQKCATALLSGDPKAWELFDKEEVITILPGKRHITLRKTLETLRRNNGTATVVEHAQDVARGECIAREGVALVVHGKTLERFGCYSSKDFEETLERVFENLREATPRNDHESWLASHAAELLKSPKFVAFSVLRASFIERTRIVTETDVLDKETRRAWTALRWCLREYAGACLGEPVTRSGRLAWNARRMHVVLGDSNVAEAWTDAASYIAIHIKHVQRLRTEPLLAASHIFGLVEHEIAHEGDSLDCGHDEAFYHRYHDISIRMAAERQRYLHIWLMKYTQSMAKEGRPASGTAWRERMLVDRVGNGRKKRDLGPVIDDLSGHPLVTQQVPEENTTFIANVNVALVTAGLCPRPPDWSEVVARALAVQQQADAEERELERAQRQMYEEDCAEELEREHSEEAEARRIASELGVGEQEISYSALEILWGLQGAPLQRTWGDLQQQQSEWMEGMNQLERTTTGPESTEPEPSEYFGDYRDWRRFGDEAKERLACEVLTADLRPLARDGETIWGMERNAAAAGFSYVRDYLRWRDTQEA